MDQRWTLVVLVLALSAAIKTDAYKAPSGKKDLAAVIACLQQRGNFKTFLSYIRQSGLDGVLGRYINSQAVSILTPNDKAFARLPIRVSSQLKGGKLIKLVENHLLLHNFPAAYLRQCKPASFFDTVLGTLVFKQKTALANSLAFSTTKKATPSSLAVVVDEDICDREQRLIAVHEINNVLLPASLFSTRTH